MNCEKSKPKLIVIVDVLHKKPLGFVYDKRVYRIDGECGRCGDCCKGQCRWIDFEKNGLAICLLHGRIKPWDCFLYPATRNPDLPLHEKCKYTVTELKDRDEIISFILLALGVA